MLSYCQLYIGSTRLSKTSLSVRPSACLSCQAEFPLCLCLEGESCMLFSCNGLKTGPRLTYPKIYPLCRLSDDKMSQILAFDEDLTSILGVMQLLTRSISHVFYLLLVSYLLVQSILTFYLVLYECLLGRIFDQFLLIFLQKVLRFLYFCHQTSHQSFQGWAYCLWKDFEPFPSLLIIRLLILSKPWLNYDQTFLFQSFKNL